MFRIPKIDLDPFDVNPKNWPTFVVNFRDLLERCAIGNSEDGTFEKLFDVRYPGQLMRLSQRSCLYDEALIELESTYGHLNIIARTYIRLILNLPKLTHLSDYKSSLNFSTTLRGAVASFRNGGYEHELSAGSLLEGIVEKLPLPLLSGGRRL